MKIRGFLIIFLFIILLTFVNAQFGFDSPTDSDFGYDTIEPGQTLGGFLSSFFMPLNTSVFGQFDFNGGWENNGLSIIDGDLYAQQLFVFNITALNITEANLTILTDLEVQGDTTLDGTVDITETLDVTGDVIFSFKISSGKINYFR